MKEIINMTPHDITIFMDNGNEHHLPSKGSFRISSTTKYVEMFGDVQITETIFGEATNLPKFKQDRYYIVSSILCRKYPERKDFLIVNQTLRNNKGQVKGCQSLSINPF